MAHRANPLKSSRKAGQRRPPEGRAYPPALIALVILGEIALLAWLLLLPLPNTGNVGGALRRGLILLAAIPGAVPGVPFRETLLGQAIEQLRHVENLPQRLPIVLASGLIAGAAVGLGRIVLLVLALGRRLSALEVIPIAFGLGVVGLGSLTLGLGRLGLLDPWLFRLGLGALAVVGLLDGLRPWLEGKRNGKAGDSQGPDAESPIGQRRIALLGLFLIVVPFLVLMALGAMQPTIEYDSLEYHLQGPKEFFQAGRIAFLPHNVYTSMPFGVEMLHLLGMVVLDDWWSGALAGQLLIAAFAPATAALIFSAARRISTRAAWVSAIVYLTTPWVFRLGAYPFVEGPLCFYHAALIWLAARSFEPGPGATGEVEQGGRLPRSAPLPRLWALAGLLAGGAMVCKYPGLVSAVIPFGLLALVEARRRRSWEIAPAFAAGVALAVGPWLLRNALDTGNPVYPLGFEIFGGAHWDAEQDAKWGRVHGPRPFSIGALVIGLLDVAGRSDWQSPLYAMLTPLAILRPGSRRFSVALWVYVFYLFATWFLLTHRLDRFWLPLLPAAALLAGIGADWTRGRAWTASLAVALTLAIAANLAFVTTPLAGPNDWTADLDALRRSGPGVLAAPGHPSPLALLDEAVPEGARVLMVGQAGVFHQRHDLIYNTVFNREILEELARDKGAAQVRRNLAELGVTHIYVDWVEVERHLKPGGYGFTPFVTRELFDRLRREGVLGAPARLGEDHWLYPVEPAASRS